MLGAERGRGLHMMSKQRVENLMLVVIVITATGLATGQTHKDFRYTVHAGSSVSVSNPYGPISVSSAAGNTIVVNVVLHSDKVEIDQVQHGNRIEINSHLLPGADADSGQVEYVLSVPADASVNMRTSTGPLKAEKMHCDLMMEATTATVDVHDVQNAHVHVRTLSGPVSLTNIKGGHVEVNSVSGDVMLNTVTGPNVQVISSSGKIIYNGDFGIGGEYSLSSHTGDIEATAPPQASIDVVAQSTKGTVDSDFSLEPRHTSFTTKVGSTFAGTMNKALSLVKLNSFSGKIHLRKASKPAY
jgi:DUF4097 and DUF4098 domain-containing protein YvlB